MSNVADALEIREKYTHFRILVIGRANAGKTTLLKRVCNTSDEPCIYDEKNNNLIEPTDDRGIHDINKPFAFSSNPEFIFHDSPGFEAGGEKELISVQEFIEERAKATNVNDQLHAIWFCLISDGSRPLLELEKKFFQEKGTGKVPVIAIFTKFDDLVTQVWDDDKTDDENHMEASRVLQEKLRDPLYAHNVSFPPKQDVWLQDMYDDDGNHQEQVKSLIEKTADALDNLALKKLFVSVQQNNLELCIKYAVAYFDFEKDYTGKTKELVKACLEWFQHSYVVDCNYDKTELPLLSVDGDPDLHLVHLHLVVALHACLVHHHLHLDETCKQVANIIEIHFKNTPNAYSTMFAATIICTEHAFWNHSQLFVTAFKQALQLYNTSGKQKELETLIPDCAPINSKMVRLLLMHCLSEM